MPPFPIVDTHVHFTDIDRHQYPELEAAPRIHKTQLPGDLDRHSAPIAIDKIVFVEVAVAEEYQILEVDFVTQLARTDPRIEAIVASAPVETGAAVDERLEGLSHYPLVRGVRRLIQNQPDPEFCARPDFVEGVRCVGKRGLHFEICIYHHQLGAALRLVRQCPDVTFILDHIGKPAIRHDLIEPWWSQIRELAELPNVHCKVSGVLTEAQHTRWFESHVRPYVYRVLDVFGIDRVMYGSDWPVSELSHRYSDWVAILDRVLSCYSEADRRKFYRDNAIAFYRLG